MMVRRLSFILLCFLLVAGLGVWSLKIRNVEASPPVANAGRINLEIGARQALQMAQRADLVEVLDQLVAGEHEFQSVYGRFTRVIGQIGVAIPPSLNRAYEIVVTEATSDRLQINAFSEWNGQTEDVATIDQNFQAYMSFALPEPRPEYLKTVALRNLRAHHGTHVASATGDLAAVQASSTQSLVFPVDHELTLFRGYFEYLGGPHPVAIGKRAPVDRVQVEDIPEAVAESAASERAPASSSSETPAAVNVSPVNRGLVIESINGDH